MSDFVKYLKKEYGDDMVSEEVKPLSVIPTGSLALDVAIGIGGIPKSKFTEISGSEGTGKTTLCLEVSKNAIQAGDKVLYIDVENMLDIDYAIAILGDSYSQESFIIIQPDTGENALMIVEDGLKSGEFGLIVIDSVGALAPKREKEKDLDDSTVGETARLISKFLRRSAFFVRRNDVAVVFINQIRDKVGGYMGGYETPGGHALKHYLSLRISLNKGKNIEVDKVKIGVEVPFSIKKNKVGVPYRSFTFPINFGEGIDTYGEIIGFAKMLGIIKTRGPYYVFGEEKLGQGRAKAIEYLKENTETLDKIRKMCYDTVNSKKSVDESEEEIASWQTLKSVV